MFRKIFLILDLLYKYGDFKLNKTVNQNHTKQMGTFNFWTHQTPKLPSYRNQSIDLHDGNFGVQWVKNPS